MNAMQNTIQEFHDWLKTTSLDGHDSDELAAIGSAADALRSFLEEEFSRQIEDAQQPFRDALRQVRAQAHAAKYPWQVSGATAYYWMPAFRAGRKIIPAHAASAQIGRFDYDNGRTSAVLLNRAPMREGSHVDVRDVYRTEAECIAANTAAKDGAL